MSSFYTMIIQVGSLFVPKNSHEDWMNWVFILLTPLSMINFDESFAKQGDNHDNHSSHIVVN